MATSSKANVYPIQSARDSSVDEARIDEVFAKQQKTALALRRTTAAERIAKIERLRDCVLAHKDELYAACAADFGKPPTEVDLGELMPIVGEANHAVKHLADWMQPVSVRRTLAAASIKPRIQRQPMGVTLIIAPWNYPVNLALGPAISAIAAGNTVMLKPSEMTPHSAAFVRMVVEECFDEGEVAVFEGDAAVATALLAKPFDHIFFTGSPAIGRVVMTAAAKHLTKVTLELGGKTPTIVDDSADLEAAAKSIAFGKWNNAGQTCVAPDYLYVHERVKDAFVAKLREVIEHSYGRTADEQVASKDFARIVNERHHGRIASMLEESVSGGATVEVGGEVRGEGENFIAPTVLTGVSMDSRVMNEEIFGPLLPILPFADLGEVIDHVNANPKPLALYLYSRDRRNIDRVLIETSSGDACINTSVMHFLHANLPFGGVNNSGLGKAHGEHGFLAFSHERAIAEEQAGKYSPTLLMAPPYTARVKTLVKQTLRWLI